MEHSLRSLDDPRWKFLRGVFISNSIRDAITTRTGRHVYAGPPTPKQSADLWYSVEAGLDRMAKAYVLAVQDEQHIENIGTLQSGLTENCGSFLYEGIITFGVAQKALNTYLKYLWCDCLIPAPPHCPFDSRILGLLKLPQNCEWRWTRGSIEDYRQWVDAAKKIANTRPLCEWELGEWEKAAPTS
ncbi:MAG TPA: hypothetical protein VG225_00055 [Terracidiphilus sp.]|jgi:hypothetical protein|nr:hypothetical protein [Terracidiphilus sp.]